MINILYCGNDKVFDGVLLSLLSITKHNKEALNVIILSLDLTEKDPKFTMFSEKHRVVLEKEIKAVNNESQVKVLDVKNLYVQTFENSKNENTLYTPYALIRLIADRIEEVPDKVLYLDYDTMAYNNIRELYDIDLENYELAGVLDYYGKFWIDKNYMNSGVLLCNMKEIRNTKLFEKCVELLKVKKLVLPDQSAINKMVKKYKLLPSKFNEQHKLAPDTVIRHFSAIVKYLPFPHKYNIKPWHVEKLHKKYKCYEFDDIIEKWQKITKKI